MAVVRVVGCRAPTELGRHRARHADGHIRVQGAMPEVERLESNVLEFESPVTPIQPTLVDGSLRPLAMYSWMIRRARRAMLVSSSGARLRNSL